MVNLTPQKTAVSSAIVGKTDTLRSKELAIVGKTEPAHQVFGDWRDLRGAIERADPSWAAGDEGAGNAQWDFAEAVLGEYAPLKFQCGGCKQVLPIGSSYRCADCHAPYCGACIRPHFGANHRNHA